MNTTRNCEHCGAEHHTRHCDECKEPLRRHATTIDSGGTCHGQTMGRSAPIVSVLVELDGWEVRRELCLACARRGSLGSALDEIEKNSQGAAGRR